MADEPIQIVVTDGVARTIAPAIEGIAAASDTAATATQVLQTEIGKFGGFSEQARVSARDFAAALRQAGGELNLITPGMLGLTESMNTQVVAVLEDQAALRGLTEAQIELYKAQQDGLNFMNALNEGFGISAAAGTELTKSARDSARAFQELTPVIQIVEQTVRGLTLAQIDLYRAQQAGANFQQTLNEAFGIAIAAGDSAAKSARESAAAFTQLMEVQDAAASSVRGYTVAQLELLRAQETGAAFQADLNASFGLTANGAAIAGKSARESAASFIALAEAEETAAVATEEVGVAARSTNGVLGSLVGTLATFFAIREVVSAVDSYTKLQNALRLAGLSGRALQDEFNSITQIAKDNGTSIDTLSSLYSKLAIAQQIVGLNSAQLNTVTKVVAESFRIQGVSAQQSYNTMRDLGDIADLTTVKWANFYRLQQQDPALIRAAAAGLGVTLQALDKQVKDSQLSTEAFFQAIIKGAPAMQAFADVSKLTITGSLNNLHTAFVQLVSDTQNSTGVIYLVALAIQALANNLPAVTTAVILFGGAWLAFKLYGIAEYFVVSFIPALIAFGIEMGAVALTTLTAAAPFLILAAAVVAAGAALLAITGQTDNFINGIKGVAAAAFSGLGLDRIGDALKGVTGVSADAEAKVAALTKGLSSAGGEAESTSTSLTKFGAAANSAALATSGLGTAVANTNDKFGKATATLVGFSTEGYAVYDTVRKISAGITELDDSLNGVNATLQTTSERMSALAKAKAAAPALFNDPGNDNGAFTDITGNFSGGNPMVPAFASGGSFYVGGKAGTDANRVSFYATQGERVDVLTTSQQAAQRQPTQAQRPVVVNIYTPDVDGFRRSKAQIARDVGNMLAVGSSNG